MRRHVDRTRPDWVRAILAAAGFDAIGMQRCDVPLFPGATVRSPRRVRRAHGAGVALRARDRRRAPAHHHRCRRARARPARFIGRQREPGRLDVDRLGEFRMMSDDVLSRAKHGRAPRARSPSDAVQSLDGFRRPAFVRPCLTFESTRLRCEARVGRVGRRSAGTNAASPIIVRSRASASIRFLSWLR